VADAVDDGRREQDVVGGSQSQQGGDGGGGLEPDLAVAKLPDGAEPAAVDFRGDQWLDATYRPGDDKGRIDRGQRSMHVLSPTEATRDGGRPSRITGGGVVRDPPAGR
jgi:hypothetical protein